MPGKPRKTNRPPGEPGNSRDRKAPDFDQNLDPFVVALIDSGVDHAEINAHHWENHPLPAAGGDGVHPPVEAGLRLYGQRQRTR